LGNEARALDVESPHDVTDQSISSLERESLFEQGNQLWTTARRIDDALRRIRTCTFGRCVSCGDDIQMSRLEAIPWTQYCRRCQERLEQDEGLQSLPDTRQAGNGWRRAG
jgi:DnaK suppressor protein